MSYTVVNGGTVNRRKTSWDVHRVTIFNDDDGRAIDTTTYLIGSRGGEYHLRPVNGNQPNLNMLVSSKNGGEYRPEGNRVLVTDVDGVIEFQS